MLLNKTHLLKSKFNILKKLFEDDIEKNVILETKNKELEKRLEQLEDQVKNQSYLNESIMNQLKAHERERVKVIKDIQIIVATLGDVYNLVQSNIFEQDAFDDGFSKKTKKSNTYH